MDNNIFGFVWQTKNPRRQSQPVIKSTSNSRLAYYYAHKLCIGSCSLLGAIEKLYLFRTLLARSGAKSDSSSGREQNLLAGPLDVWLAKVVGKNVPLTIGPLNAWS